MKIVYDWLKEFIDTERGPDQAAEALTNLGLEACAGKALNGLDVLDVEITSNRPDCLSVRGIARELAASWGLELKGLEFSLEEGGNPASESIEIEIKSGLCPRYCARVIRGIKPGPSPGWLSRRIEASGIRSINNVVDATNYSLLATGHPLHAFDLNSVAGRRVIIRQAESGEKILTLDGEERKLDPSMLVIADMEKPIALAGVMGGAETEVGDSTVDVLLEGAYFAPAAVRRAAKALQMDTEASYRFQRGADIEDIIPSLDYAAYLIRELSGGEIARGAVDCRTGAGEHVAIKLRVSRLRSVLGADIDGEFIEEKLSLSGFGVKKKEEGVFDVSVPSSRRDVYREIDLIEEAARFYGYENIPATMPSGASAVYKVSDGIFLQKELRSLLVSAGLNEAVNNGLISPASAEPFSRCMRLLNPLSEEQAVLRPGLLPGLLENIETNIRHGARDIRLFELGSIFAGGCEKLSLAGVMAGSPPTHWKMKSEPFGYFEIKGIVEKILEETALPCLEFLPCESGVFDPAESAVVKFGDEAGMLGKLSADICGKFGIDMPVYAFELDFDSLLKYQHREKKFKPLPKFPPSFRDAAFVVGEEVESADVEKTACSAGGDILAGVWLFDIYRGKQVPPGSKSMAYSFCYRSAERTLADKEVSEVHDKIVKAVMEEFNAALREE